MKNRTEHHLMDQIDAADPLAAAKFIRDSGKDIFILVRVNLNFLISKILNLSIFKPSKLFHLKLFQPS